MQKRHLSAHIKSVFSNLSGHFGTLKFGATDASLTFFLEKREKAIIAVLLCLAFLRIFLFAAAFPFFNNVDEQLHFDLVYRYSIGDKPKEAVVNFSAESAKRIVLYASPEYFSIPMLYRGSRFFQPVWSRPFVEQSPNFKAKVKEWQNRKNHEAAAFPLPYKLMALWCKLGHTLGIQGGDLLYWIRFLNVPVFSLLVFFSWIIARTFFPDDTFQRIGVPLMMTFFPQDLFYGITNDSFSALLFAFAFFIILQIYFRRKSVFYHVLAGFTVALAFLSKISNIAVIAFMGLVVLLKVRRLVISGKVTRHLLQLMALLFSFGLPITYMLFRNYNVLGDFTGIADVTVFQDWTFKPLGDLFQHPVFTLSGFSLFLQDLTRTFWRGEVIWHGEKLAYEWIDLIYVFTSGIFLLLACWHVFRNKNERERFVLEMSFLVVAVSVLFLLFLSIRFDFGDWFYPSREYPYFTSGRLISCVTVPFLLIYIRGIKIFFSRIGGVKSAFVFILLLVIFICTSEIALTWSVFQSKFNWFYLSGY